MQDRQNEDTKQNNAAWEFDAYQFWVTHAGTPAERAKETVKNPIRALKRYAKYFDSYEGKKIANICGSCGKKAVPLALLGAEVTVFDISKENQRYACEMAEAANTQIDFVVGDVLSIDMLKYGETFDYVFMEGGILHYFYDLEQFMELMRGLLKNNGILICSDFHPFRKIKDTLNFEQPTMSYFSTDIIEGEMAHAKFYPSEIRATFPKCHYRFYNLSEIMNSILINGFRILRFDEHPSWVDENLPGVFTILARKEND